MKDYLDFKPSGDLKNDVRAYFNKFGRMDTFEHTLDVVNELNYIKEMFGSIEPESLTACYCHDLGRTVQSDDIIPFCLEEGIEVTEEEKTMPSILHQKISCFIAERVFNITDETVLNGIRYHTTMRKNPSMTEIEVYLSDKMSWREEGYVELARKVKECLKNSKEYAVFYYLSDMHNSRSTMKLYHRDTMEAYEYFNDMFSK